MEKISRELEQIRARLDALAATEAEGRAETGRIMAKLQIVTEMHNQRLLALEPKPPVDLTLTDVE